MIICVDFDGTIVKHKFPEIGEPLVGAFYWLKTFQDLGAKLILWTMRNDRDEPDAPNEGLYLTAAVEICKENDIVFWGVNRNPEQYSWTDSPKAYADVYIDDAAFGCPLKESATAGERPYVDWDVVGPAVVELILAKQEIK